MYLPGTFPNKAYLDLEFMAAQMYHAAQPLISIEFALKAMALRPDLPSPYNGFGMAHARFGYLEEAIGFIRRAIQLNPARHEHQSNLLFLYDLLPGVTPEAIIAERRAWVKSQFGDEAKYPRPPARSLLPDRLLNVGYVSGDWREHSASRMFTPVMRAHNAKKFRVFAYSSTDRDVYDAFTAQYKKEFIWRDISTMSDVSAANLIKRDKIDILVDASGHTRGHRLKMFARRPAPIQIQAFGPLAPEMDFFDGFVAHPGMFPEDQRDSYGQRVLDAPAFLCMPWAPDMPMPSPPPFQRNGFVTFGTMSRLDKVNMQVVMTWAHILKQVPDSRLIVKSEYLDGADIAAKILRNFNVCGIESHRIKLIGRSSRAQHLGMLTQVDIALDTWPNNGGATTLETLWSGVPVVTFMGDVPGGRVAGSILQSIGMGNWVGKSLEEYVALAIGFAGLPDVLAELRPKLPEAMARTEWGNPGMFVRGLEDIYRREWHAFVERRLECAA